MMEKSCDILVLGGGLVDGLFVTGGIKKQVLNDMSWALASGYIAGESAARSLR